MQLDMKQIQLMVMEVQQVVIQQVEAVVLQVLELLQHNLDVML